MSLIIPKQLEKLDFRPSESFVVGRSQLACISNTGDAVIAPTARALASVQNQLFKLFGYTSHTFTSQHLHSYSRLKKYLEENRAVEEVGKQPKSKVLLGSWQVIEMKMAAPFLRLYTIFLGAVGNLLFYAGLTTSIRLAVHKRLYNEDKRLQALQTFEEDCLSFSVNARAQNSDDVYLQSPLRVEDIRSRKVRGLLHPDLSHLVFYKDGGCCRGMSEWFLYLYFQTRDNFQDEEAHIQAVGRQFSDGACSEAVLLQTMCPTNRELLGLTGREVHVLHASQDDSNQKRVTDLFAKLKPGSYAVNLPRHRLNYISLSPGKGYLFDPTDGTIAIKNAKAVEKLSRRVLSYCRDSDPTLLALETIEPLP